MDTPLSDQSVRFSGFSFKQPVDLVIVENTSAASGTHGFSLFQPLFNAHLMEDVFARERFNRISFV